jgi:hypothetical protein
MDTNISGKPASSTAKVEDEATKFCQNGGSYL